MADVQDVAILHDVVLTFQSERAFGARVGFRTRFEKLIPADGFGADEMLFQIGVNRAGRFLREGVGGNLPGAAFILAGGEKRNQPEQLIRGADQAYESTLFETIARQELGRVGVDTPYVASLPRKEPKE